MTLKFQGCAQECVPSSNLLPVEPPAQCTDCCAHQSPRNKKVIVAAALEQRLHDIEGYDTRPDEVEWSKRAQFGIAPCCEACAFAAKDASMCYYSHGKPIGEDMALGTVRDKAFLV